MPQDRVSDLLNAYFNQPYDQYGDLVLEIKKTGGLTSEEIQAIERKVLYVDAATMVRQSGSTS